MKSLSIDEILYLLYACSYSREEGTVTRSHVAELIARDKKELSKQLIRKEVDCIYETLLEQKLIDSPRNRRLLVTDLGIKALISNLGVIHIDLFHSAKGEKLLNTLIYLIKLSTLGYSDSSTPKTMSFSTFFDKIRHFYFEVRKHQELDGVVAIHKQELLQEFLKDNSANITKELMSDYFEHLKSTGKVFTSKGEKDELVHWVE
jgi:hypothetical protein